MIKMKSSELLRTCLRFLATLGMTHRYSRIIEAAGAAALITFILQVFSAAAPAASLFPATTLSFRMERSGMRNLKPIFKNN